MIQVRWLVLLVLVRVVLVLLLLLLLPRLPPRLLLGVDFVAACRRRASVTERWRSVEKRLHIGEANRRSRATSTSRNFVLTARVEV